MLLQATHPDAQYAVPAQTHGTDQGRISFHLMNISTRLYAAQMPSWHEVIQSEVIRSLILAGSPSPMPPLSTTPISPGPPLQQGAASQDARDQQDSLGGIPIAPLLTREGRIDKQAAESASAHSEPILLHQGLQLATAAHWVPRDFGARESDSSDSDSAVSSPGEPEPGEEEAAQAGLAAAGLDRLLAVAVLAAYQCCPQPPDQEDNARTDSSSNESGQMIAVKTNLRSTLRMWVFVGTGCCFLPIQIVLGVAMLHVQHPAWWFLWLQSHA